MVSVSSRPGEGDRRGDLSTGKGLTSALAGAQAIVHTASAPRGDPWQVDVAGARRLVQAVDRDALTHLVFISIVGVDTTPYSYYRAKLAAEQVLLASSLPVTVVRATQFHDFVDEVLATARLGPVLPVPAGWRLQPVEREEVATHLAELIERQPDPEIQEIAGPQALSGVDLARRWAAARSHPPLVIPVPVPGGISRAFRRGAALPRAGTRGTGTYEQHLVATSSTP